MADIINGRIKSKRDTTANWNRTIGFVPLQGEIIVYEDYQSYTKGVNIYNKNNNPIESGSIADTNGTDIAATNRVRSSGTIPIEKNKEYRISSNQSQIFMVFYAANGTYLSNSNWQTSPYTFTTPNDCGFIRFVIGNINDTTIIPSDIDWVKIEYDKIFTIPGIKIGNGNAYVQDLAFIDTDLRDKIMGHIENQDIHVTLGEKAFWDNKVNIDDSHDIPYEELEDEILIFNRL